MAALIEKVVEELEGSGIALSKAASKDVYDERRASHVVQSAATDESKSIEGGYSSRPLKAVESFEVADCLTFFVYKRTGEDVSVSVDHMKIVEWSGKNAGTECSPDPNDLESRNLAKILSALKDSEEQRPIHVDRGDRHVLLFIPGPATRASQFGRQMITDITLYIKNELQRLSLPLVQYGMFEPEDAASPTSYMLSLQRYLYYH